MTVNVGRSPTKLHEFQDGGSTSAAASVEHRKRRKKSARFREIALEAGVSETTVDRVLNERGSVSDTARKRVIAAATKLQVPRILPDIRHGLLHVDVLLPRNTSPMFKRLERALNDAIQLLDKRIVVHRVTLDRKNDEAFARAILKTPYRRSGLIVVGSTTNKTLAALQTILGSGEAVVALVTDLPGAHYVGINNKMAGRTAGHMIGKITRGEGRVLILRGLEGYPAHDERVSGCIEALQEADSAQEVVVGEMETNDDPDICYRLVYNALQRGPISAIYNSGDGAAGVHKALKRFDLLGKVAWIGHELQDEHCHYLQKDWMELVIDQNPDAQAFAAIQHILVACGLQKPTPTVSVGELRLYTKPNAVSRPYL